MADTKVIREIQHKRGTLADLTAVLKGANKPLSGELIWEIDTNRLKIGNGEDDYEDLAYLTSEHVDDLKALAFKDTASGDLVISTIDSASTSDSTFNATYDSEEEMLVFNSSEETKSITLNSSSKTITITVG